MVAFSSAWCWLALLTWLPPSFCQAARTQVDASRSAALSRAIREHYRASGFNWMSPRHLQELDQVRNLKPYMYLFTTSSCAECRDMMSELTNESPVWLSNLSAQFNAVLVLDDYALELGPEYSPGNADYTPRVIFADPDGKVRLDIVNKKGDKAVLYYYTAREMLWQMRQVLLMFTAELAPYPSDLLQDMP